MSNSTKPLSAIAHWNWDFITPAVDKLRAARKRATACPKLIKSWAGYMHW